MTDPLDEKIDEILLETCFPMFYSSVYIPEIAEAKQQLKALFTEHTKEVEKSAQIKGAENFHRYIFDHFELLPKIQGKNGTTHSTTFNEGNYQAVACDLLAQLSKQESKE